MSNLNELDRFTGYHFQGRFEIASKNLQSNTVCKRMLKAVGNIYTHSCFCECFRQLKLLRKLIGLIQTQQ